MSDADPEDVYGNHNGEYAADIISLIDNEINHSDKVIHQNDKEPVSIIAGHDIASFSVSVPKKAIIQAGNDIVDINYKGQNLNSEDVTEIIAGNSILFSTEPGLPSSYEACVEMGGPGMFRVQAGNTIELGRSDGISTLGNVKNPYLSQESSELIIISGYDTNISETAVVKLFAELQAYGVDYSTALAEGDIEAAAEYVEKAREELLDPYGFESCDTGNIDMINSKISSSGEEGSISIISGGTINVGRSTFTEGAADTGIYTSSGGDIDIYAINDINVNESKVMTYRSGDITMWSDQGDINAGRGSKVAVDVDPPRLVYQSNGEYTLEFEAPAVGSGIRALTYDPDGYDGPELPPDAGNLYIFAPEGEIDAGEAGIYGQNVILGATEIINAQNIEVGGTSVGVPDVSGAGPSLAALSGAGSVSETAGISEDDVIAGTSEERFSKYVDDLSESLVPKWLSVEVLGFVDGEARASETDEEEEEKE